VRSSESLACLQLCSGSPVGHWWKPCSYRLAVQWRRSCCQWAPRWSAGVFWVVGQGRCLTHPTLNTSSASSSGCSHGDRFGKHFRKCRNMIDNGTDLFRWSETRLNVEPCLWPAKQVCSIVYHVIRLQNSLDIHWSNPFSWLIIVIPYMYFNNI